MFKDMRKKERELDEAETKEILKKCEYGILSTVSENGYPYGVPVDYIYFNDSVYFHCATEGHKLDNILNNDKVSFCAVGQTCVLPEKFSTKYESVIIFGKAAEVTGREKEAAMTELLYKYSGSFAEKGKEYIKNADNKVKVIKIRIDHMSGKASR